MSHLSNEKSPYLLQHVDNPVDWYPWAEDAFARARDENRLIFLSIGYSTCHWCHVMAHECFEDDEVAKLLNGDYVSIKVDREERPDIDQVYMEICQRLTGSGGWPLTIIMTPDARPFYAATYIPKHGRQGRPGLMQLLPWVVQKWQESPEFLTNAAHEIITEMQRSNPAANSPFPGLALHDQAESSLVKGHDSRFGGFGRAPKFPRPHDLLFLMQRYRLHGNQNCLEIAEKTLHHMRCGGIYDQLGYGFHRYATDEKWLVPHFEKMLYDQAGLITAYLEAWRLTGKELYAATAREILTYLQRDMSSPEGAFYSAEDADSEGEEGVFYLWTREQINEVLSERGDDFCQAYNVKEVGNFHDEVSGQLSGRNILHLAPAAGDVVELMRSFQDDREALVATRAKRIRPHLDDKVITAWNGMMISALAGVAGAFGEQGHFERARRVAEFICERMTDEQARLLRRYRQGEAAIRAFSEDYAFLVRGLLDLYAFDFDVTWLSRAAVLAHEMIDLFQDPESGKLYDTPTDGEPLLIRPASTFDGATPAAGSIALEVFARLYLLTGDSAWQTAAEQLMSSMSAEISRYPAGYTQFLQSSNWLLKPTLEIVVVGEAGAGDTAEMLAVARSKKQPGVTVLFKSCNDPDEIVRLCPFVAAMEAVGGRATAYVCQGFACREPLQDIEEFAGLFESVPN